MEMDDQDINSQLKVIVIHNKNTNDICISFRYVNEDLDFNRFFNFQRQANEKCTRILTRISDNILKFITKKSRKSKKNSKDTSLPDSINISLVSKNDRETQDVEKLSCFDIFVCKADDLLLKIENIYYEFDVNPPLITNLELPKKNIMAGFFVYPIKLEGLNYDINDTLLKWFTSKEKFESFNKAKNNLENIAWEQFDEGFHVVTSNEDVFKLLKVVCTPLSGNRKGPDFECIFGDLISAGPGFCPFEKRHLFTNSVLDKNRLRVVSYNLLADLYADSDHSRNVLYPYCPPYALSMEYRKQLFLRELLGYKADIICLQEVDEKIYNRDLAPLLNKFGFKGVYQTKGGETVAEGVATFYRTDKLRLLDKHRYFFNEELESNPLFSDLAEKLKKNETLYEVFQRRTTVLQVCVLETVEPPTRILVVGVTHLYFEPYSDHIRLLQGGMGLIILRHIVRLQEMQGKDVSLLFCGDFNSAPENGVYRLFTTQLIDLDDPDWTSKRGEEVSGVTFSHDLEIGSACGTPDFTNYTTGFYGCLDYIYYQTNKFEVEQVIPLPSLEEVTQHVALPSVTIPSDHLALVADLKWKT